MRIGMAMKTAPGRTCTTTADQHGQRPLLTPQAYQIRFMTRPLGFPLAQVARSRILGVSLTLRSSVPAELSIWPGLASARP